MTKMKNNFKKTSLQGTDIFSPLVLCRMFFNNQGTAERQLAFKSPPLPGQRFGGEFFKIIFIEYYS